MAFLQLHSPALAVACPLAAAILLLALGNHAKGLGKTLFLAGILSGACFAVATALRVVLSGVPVDYVFGAPAGAKPLDSVAGVVLRIAFRIDALGALCLFPAAIVSCLAGHYSCLSERDTTGGAAFRPLFLLLSAGVYGMLQTGDLFNFFVFLEITSLSGAALAAYRVDGGLATEAGFKYAALSSLATMSYLLGAALLLAQYDALNLESLAKALNCHAPTALDVAAMVFLLSALLLKCGAFPLHQWVPDVYSRAPGGVSAFLLISSQASLYALFRFAFTLFPQFAQLNGALLLATGALSMFVGVTAALAQHDVKRLISHHAVSQTGYMLLGAGAGLWWTAGAAEEAELATEALAGGLYHMVNYALYNSLLFLAAGAVIAQAKRRDLDELGGLAHRMPLSAAGFGIGAIAIAGLPPLSGFASKWGIYATTFRLNPFWAVVAMAVGLMTLASFVKVFHSVFLGPQKEAFASVEEAPRAMTFPLVVLAVLTILIGLFPGWTFETLVRPAAAVLTGGAR